MVLSRNDKRKKREGDLVDLMEPLSESPKRTKVHAQRKFAQGASTVFTTSPIPVKDKEKVKPSMITELITHKRPNTEDFLTYLCFRGTSILPSSLNFFNFNNAKENLEPKPKPKPKPMVADTSAEPPKQETCQKNVTKVKPVVPEKKKMPSTIHKNISKLKTATSTVQALKKKYQEQRLAKQRIENKLKATCVRTRSSTERATLNTEMKLAPEKFLPRIQTKRHGLRSGLLLNKTNTSLPKTKITSIKPKKKNNSKSTNTESSNTDESLEEDNKEETDETESQSEKVTSQIRRNIQRNIQKNDLLLNKSHKSMSKAKIAPVKPKKKINSRSTSTESSNTDESVEEEDDKEEINEDGSQSEKATSQVRRNIQKNIQKTSLLLNKTNKSLSKAKIVPVKPKKKVISRSVSTESSTDESLEEEDNKEEIDEDESRSEKATSQTRRRNSQKKICTKNKSEMKRVTRSSSGTISPKNVSTRPTRKTKEAATVYMEILGRKLIQGSELETEDNVSIESYPELPNVRKITQTENEIKAKMKQAVTKTINKNKDCKINSSNENKRLDKKTNKLIHIKSKRPVKVQTYCEEDSEEEESASSEEITERNNTRPITRLSLGKLDKPISREQRSLRSSTKNIPPIQPEEPSNTNNKSNIQAQSSVKPASEKLAVKRKRDQNLPKESSDTISESKPKSLKNHKNEGAESEEETLGMLLSKIKKKKENEEQEQQTTSILDDVSNTKNNAMKHSEMAQSTKADLSKVSDDEESFRGFTKKAISKVLDSCQTHANVNMLTDEKIDYVKMMNITPINQSVSSQKEETSVKDVSSGISTAAGSSNNNCIKTSLKHHKLLLDSTCKTQDLPSSSTMQTSKNYSHEDEVSPNLRDMPTALRSRKERINMSTERIEKWLNESSLAKEESKLEMENVSTFKYDSTEKMKMDVSHLSIPTKIQHLVRPVNVTLSKLMDKTSPINRLKLVNKNVTPLKSNTDTAEVKLSTANNQNKMNTDVKEVLKNKSAKTNKDIAKDDDSASKLDQNKTDDSTRKKSSTDKKIFQLRKPFLPKVKERKTAIPNANAFSPENESSVYAFESDTEVPVNTPFRRKVKDTAKSTQQLTEKLSAKLTAKSASKSIPKSIAKPIVRSIVKLISKPTAIVPAVASTSSTAASMRSTIAPMTSTTIPTTSTTAPTTSMTALTTSTIALTTPIITPITSTVTFTVASTITSTVISTVISTVASTVVSTVTSTAISTIMPTVTSVTTPTLAVMSTTPSTIESTSKTQVATELNTSVIKESPVIPNVLSSSEKSTSDTDMIKDQEITAEAISVPNTALNLNNLVDLTNITVLPLNKQLNNWNNENCSSSIAVQVNFDENTKEQQVESDEQKTAEKNANQQNTKSNEISTQTEADNDEQLFYIPLQAIARSGPNLQKRQLIQGVAVKLGTEGRAGPNQRVLLRAKLVTKSPLAMALHPPPVGTVQPTTRGPPSPPDSSSLPGHPPDPPNHPPDSSSHSPDPSRPFDSTRRHLSSTLTTTSLKVASSPVPVAITSIMPAPAPTNMIAITPPTVVTNTPITAVANTPATVVATTPTTAVATTSTTLAVTTSTTVAAITSSAEMQSTLPAISDVQVTSTSRQSNSTSNSLDRLRKSPISSREKKASIDSAKSGKRTQMKHKQKASESSSASNNSYATTSYINDEIFVLEAPTFHPTEKDFQDPLEYIDKIRPSVEKFGICKVVPPANFKPECKVSDDMRFTAYNQYVHRMLHRWGPNVKELMAIKKYLATQSITLSHPPWIGGMEVDLPHLYQTVQNLGGLKEVIEKKKWQKVADGMKIPKCAQDRVTKLDDIYCKYLLPYDTLSPEEREKLFDEVEQEWKKRESKALERQETSSTDNDEEEEEDSSDEIEECIVKGRNMPLNAFYRIARNTQRMWFGENQRGNNETEGASADEVENAFWKHVAERKRHVCVHAASIDSSGRGFGFSVVKNSPFARHPWNLKVLTNNAGSILRALGPLMGVTVPTLHVGMLFSACCWYRDPHGLPWIEYLHTGAKKIWYGIPDEHNNSFREALTKMVPQYCKNKTIWLPSDTAMVPPKLLIDNGVSLCQIVQEPGQFIIVFPKAFTSSICTGYVVSESVYFAQPSWLETAEQVFKDIQDSCEPSIFSFERLLFNIINDTRFQIDILKQILPSVIKIRKKELDYRKQLENLGLTKRERVPLPGSKKENKRKRVKEDESDYECETCRANLFVSMVTNSQDEGFYCLPHALQLLNRKKQVLKHCTLMYTYDEDELDELIQKLESRIEAKSKKTNQIKQNR